MMAAADRQVVLRDALFTAGAVRLPRGPCAPTVKQPDAGQAPAPSRAEDAALVALRSAAHAEGHAEGQRLGYDDGLRRGIAAGEEKARAEAEAAARVVRDQIADKHRRLDALLVAMADAADQAWAGAEEDVLALCYQALCSVFGAAATSPAALRAQVAGLLANCDLKGAMTLHLHPSDAALFDEARELGQLPCTEGRALHWRADARVALGGCILAGAGGGIDARLETVLEQCKAGLLQARARRSPARDAVEGAP